MLCSLSFSQTVPRQANPYGWPWGSHTALRQNSFSANVYTAGASWEHTWSRRLICKRHTGTFNISSRNDCSLYPGCLQQFTTSISFSVCFKDNSALTRSSGKGACCQDWPLDFKSWELHGGRETTPESCPLGYTHTPQTFSLKSIITSLVTETIAACIGKIFSNRVSLGLLITLQGRPCAQ